jgi:hypothetical protein
LTPSDLPQIARVLRSLFFNNDSTPTFNAKNVGSQSFRVQMPENLCSVDDMSVSTDPSLKLNSGTRSFTALPRPLGHPFDSPRMPARILQHSRSTGWIMNDLAEMNRLLIAATRDSANCNSNKSGGNGNVSRICKSI